MSKNGSPKYQVAEALGKIYRHDRKRHRDKALGLAHRFIYDDDTLDNYIADGTQFAKWSFARWGIHDIRHLKARHARLFLDDLAANERAG
ncbi:MAG: hypothetical protein KKB13_21975, partial [Chloroflexi bacterium]|nr:hypothetical protein [Chloroflexota bacterium]